MSVVASEYRERRAPWSLAGVVNSPFFFWGVLLLYLAAHIALRMWETPNIAKNDVQEAVAAQAWAWGYHPRNPPLHTWLLMGSYAIFGVRLFAHVMLKYALLGVTFSFAYLCGRELLTTRTAAILSALALSIVGPFAWTVHTALTHTLLLAAVNFGTLWAAIRLTKRRATIDYAVFGLMIALGLLAKYSYLLFFGPLIAAMLTQADLRRALADKRIFLTLLVAALVFAPHGLWMLDARFDFARFLAEKQRSASRQPYLADLASGLGAVAYSALAFLGPFAIVFPLAFRKSLGTKPSAPASPWARATALTIALSLSLLVLDVIVLRATQFEQRYMMCALLLVPLAAALWIERRNPSKQAIAAFAISIAAIAVLVFPAIAGRALFEQRSCHRCWEEMAVDDLAREVRYAGFVDGTIIADHYNVAGNLRIAFPDSRIIAANYDVWPPLSTHTGQCLLVWNARNSGDPIPEAITTFLHDRHIPNPAGTPAYVNAPLRRSDRMDRFGYLLVANAGADCRPP